MNYSAVSCGVSSIPKEEIFFSRLLTPKQASGNAQPLGFTRETKSLSDEPKLETTKLTIKFTP
jgi:hypothetical protein